MKKILIALLIILLIFVLAVIVAEYNSNRNVISEPEESTNVTADVDKEVDKIVTETGAIAPGFELKDRNGDTLSLSELKGKAVLLFFWTST